MLQPRIAPTRELELLLYCMRPCFGPDVAENLRALLQCQLDWPHIMQLAEHHRAKPLLYWRLKDYGAEQVPAAVMHQLQHVFQANNRRNMYLMQRLLHLLACLNSNMITAVPYKGPVLAATIYQNLALRHAGDLDIVVHRSDLQRATESLIAAGATFLLTPKDEHYHLKHLYTYNFTFQSVFLELHWTFAQAVMNIPLELHDVAPRIECITLMGSRIPVFSPEDLLVLLCIHGMKHYWERLTWLCDVAWLLHATPNLDWNAVMQRATAYGSRRMLLLGVYLAQRMLAVDLPSEVQRCIAAEAELVFVAAQLQERMAIPLGRPAMGRTRARLYLMSRERLRDRALFVGERANVVVRSAMMPNHNDVAWLPLPPSLSFLYYFLRPFRLIQQNKYRPIARLREWYQQ